MTGRPKIARIILAAGAGSRMGKIKALLPLCGQTALERIAKLEFTPDFTETQVVCGFEADQVAGAAAALGLQSTINENWQKGQTGSLIKGIQACHNADYYLLHPVDLPLIEAEDYGALAESMAHDPGRSIYVTSYAQRRGHPIIFNEAIAEKVCALGPDDPLRNLTRAENDVGYAQVSNPWVRGDLDVPEDLEKARRHLDSKGESGSP